MNAEDKIALGKFLAVLKDRIGVNAKLLRLARHWWNENGKPTHYVLAAERFMIERLREGANL